MKIRKAYKFRLKANTVHRKLFSQFSGCNRFVWNKALAMNNKRLSDKQKLLWYQELAFFLTLWKKSEEMSFLRNAPSQTLQQTLRHLDRGFKDGFDKKQSLKRLPTFKKKGQSDSFVYPQGFKINGNRIYLPKIGWIGFRKSREIEGTPKNVTVSSTANHWYISIQVEIEVAEPVHPSQSIVGIDMGVKRFATLSDGTFYSPINSFTKLVQRLCREQRKLSKKTKNSNNWKKQKRKIQKLHSRIADCRKDFLHKTSTAISKKHAVIVLEDLRIRNMSSSAKGTTIDPGKNIRAKSSLNRSILDQGWATFRTFLEYKQQWSGGRVIPVNPQYTSQRCPSCGEVSKLNRKTQSQFSCIACGHTGNADHVAAVNILAAGHAVSACGELGVNPSLKQEPSHTQALAA